MADTTLEARVAELEATVERMRSWAKGIEERLLTPAPAADAITHDNGKEGLQFPEAIEHLELPPVPHDHTGAFATWSPDKEKNQMRIVAPEEALDNPCYSEMDGGETFDVIPVLSKAGKAGWIAVNREANRAPFASPFGINEGDMVTFIDFVNLRAVRGKQTEIDVEAWQQKRDEAMPQYPPADEEPF